MMTRYGKVTKAIYDELRAVTGSGGVVMDDAERPTTTRGTRPGASGAHA